MILNSKVFGSFLFCLLSMSIQAQEYQFDWAKSVGENIGVFPFVSTVDKDGNTYVTGSFEGTMDFDPSKEEFNLTSRGKQDIFVLMLDAIGDFVWAKSFGGTGVDVAYSIVTNEVGSVYITGVYYGKAEFGEIDSRYTLKSKSRFDYFVVKLDKQGNVIWVNPTDGGGTGLGYYVQTDTEDNSYVLGYFSHSSDFDPHSKKQIIAATNKRDQFLLKLDKDGALLWVKNFKHYSGIDAKDLCFDKENNIYITGKFTGEVDFDPSEEVVSYDARSEYDAFVLKLDSEGDFQWVKTLKGTDNVISNSILYFQHNLYLTGKFNGTLKSNANNDSTQFESSGKYDIFLQKMNPEGESVWIKTIGGKGRDAGTDLAVDSKGNLYLTGGFSQIVDFDPSESIKEEISYGDQDIFIGSFNQEGALLWLKTQGGDGRDVGHSISLDKEDKLYIGGRFEQTLYFDQEDQSYDLKAEHAKEYFVQRFVRK